MAGKLATVLAEPRLKKFLATATFRGFGAISVLILYYTITRFYVPANAAHIFFILTAAGITTPLMLTGLNPFTVKRIAIFENTGQSHPLMASILWLTVKNAVVATIAVLAAGALLWKMNFHPELFSPALIALFFAIPAFSIIGYFFQGRKLYNYSIFILNICNFLLLAAAIAINGYLRRGAGSPRDADGLMLFTSFVTLGLALFLLSRVLKLSFGEAVRSRNSFILSGADQKERFHFWGALVLLYVTNWLPQIVYYLSGAQADYAYFSVAERLSNAINFFVIISNFFLAPILSELYATGKQTEMRAQFIRITRLITLASLPFAGILIFLPGTILAFFGKDYRGGAIYLVIMASTQLFNVATGSVNTLLAMTGSEKLVLQTTFAALILELACMAIFGPLLGGVGFAIAYAANIVAQNGLAAWFTHKRLGVNVLRVFLPARSDAISLVEQAAPQTERNLSAATRGRSD